MTPWEDPLWHADALAWIDARLAEHGIARTEPPTQPHLRPWATALRVPTDAGTLWFKATAPALGHEAAVTEALSRWLPGVGPTVRAADTARAWLLMDDAGGTLRSLLPDALPLWERAMARHAQAQIDLLGRTDSLLACGVWDRRPDALAAEIAALLDDPQALRSGSPDGLSDTEQARLHALLPEIARADDALPAALYHDDFHDANIFVDGDRVTLADWGDCAVGHPFCVLTVALRSAARRLEAGPDDPRVVRLRDAYLEPWGSRVAPKDRARVLAAADRRGRLSRALTWSRVLAPLPEEARTPYGDPVTGWVQEALET